MIKTDMFISKIVHFLGYLSGVSLLVMALWATVNVIYSKITMNSIPSTNDWIAYLLVPAVFLAIGMDIMDNGLISVDLITDRFPLVIRKIIIAIGYFIGAVLSVIMCGQQYSKMRDAFMLKSKSSVAEKLAFPVWPFSLIMVIGLGVMAFAMVWFVIKYWITDGIKDLNTEGGETSEAVEEMIEEMTVEEMEMTEEEVREEILESKEGEEGHTR